MKLVELRPGFAKTTLNVEERHLNSVGCVHGGAIFTLADLAFAVASNGHGQLALAINVNISFLQGKSAGTLYATATEVGEPRRLAAYDVLITDEQDRVIARFNGMAYRKNQSVPV